MNKKIFIITTTIVVVMIIVMGNKSKDGNLLSPFNKVIQSKPTSTPIPTPVLTPNAPKTFQFDSSTDLKMELEKVNPQVLDSDFE